MHDIMKQTNILISEGLIIQIGHKLIMNMHREVNSSENAIPVANDEILMLHSFLLKK